MAKVWDSAATAAQFAGGLVLTAAALVTPGGAVLGPAVGATVSGIGLIDKMKKGRDKSGLEDPAVLVEVRKKTLQAAEAQVGTLAAQFDLADADKALAAALPQCMLDRDQLVAAAQSPAGMIDNATALVMAALAGQRAEVFGETAPAMGRGFARAVVRAALEAAIENSEYFDKLQPKLILQGQQADARIESKLDAGFEAVLASIGDLRRQQLGLSETQVRNLLIAFEQQNVDVHQAETLLLKAAGELRDLRLRLSQLSNQDEPEIAAKREAARAAIDAGDFDRADKLLSDAEQIDLEAGERRIMRAAEIMAERAALARAQAKLEVCAEHYGRAAERAASIDAEAAWRWWFRQADALKSHGKLYPGLEALTKAIAIWRDKCLSHTPRDTRGDDWARTQNSLGVALRVLGERAGGNEGLAALNDAILAHRSALEVRTRKDMPIDWAATQNNLGAALRVLERRVGGEEGLAALNQAIAAFRAALEVRTREDIPDQWAMTQNNLGAALRALSVRTDGTESLAALNGAIAAYRSALEVRTREKMPTEWAITQNNLGIVLRAFSERAEGEAAIAALKDAITAYQAALEIRTLKDMPVSWAMTQNNLGFALRMLGEIQGGEKGIATLKNAIAAYSAALEVRTREDMPANWAITQHNLGNAFRILGQWLRGEDGLAALNTAVAAYSAALEIRTRDSMLARWAITSENLAIAEATISQVTGETTPVRAAVQRIIEVIDAFKGLEYPYSVENAEQNLIWMRKVLADLESRPAP